MEGFGLIILRVQACEVLHKLEHGFRMICTWIKTFGVVTHHTFINLCMCGSLCSAAVSTVSDIASVGLH